MQLNKIPDILKKFEFYRNQVNQLNQEQQGEIFVSPSFHIPEIPDILKKSEFYSSRKRTFGLS